MYGLPAYVGPMLGVALTNIASTGTGNWTESVQTLTQKVPGFNDAQAFVFDQTGLDIVYLLICFFIFDAGRHLLTHVYTTIDDILVRWLMTDIRIPKHNPLVQDVYAWLAKQNHGGWRQRSATVQSGNQLWNELWSDDGDIAAEEEDKDGFSFVPSVGRQYFRPFGWRPFIFDLHDRSFGPGAMPPPPMPPGGTYFKEDITIRCLGWSDEPLKKFLHMCKSHSRRAGKGATVVFNWDAEDHEWDRKRMPPRPMATIELDATIKADLLADVGKYLNSRTISLYKQLGIPYRRGYLFYGLPGTGKSSLSKALAGHFDLDLYCLNLGDSGVNDSSLQRAFGRLPAKCILLLEDIDSAGIGRESATMKELKPRKDDSDDSDSSVGSSYSGWIKRRNRKSKGKTSLVTLSGLLNALDGASAAEGRIVIMTSNHPELLDGALIRRGRVDKRILLPAMSRESARGVFNRIFSFSDLPTDEVAKYADEFAAKIPEGVIVPAEVQGYLVDHLESPAAAVAGIEQWAADVVSNRVMNRVVPKGLDDVVDESGISSSSAGTDGFDIVASNGSENEDKGKDGFNSGKEEGQGQLTSPQDLTI